MGMCPQGPWLPGTLSSPSACASSPKPLTRRTGVAQAWASPRPCPPWLLCPKAALAGGCPGATLSRRGGDHIHGPAGA